MSSSSPSWQPKCPPEYVLPVCISPLLMSAKTKIFKCWSGLDVLWSLLLFVHLLYFTVACLSLHSVSKIIMEYWWKTIIKERKEWDRCMVLVRRPYFRIDWGGVFQFLTHSIILSYTWIQDGNCTPKCEYLNTHKNVKLTPKVASWTLSYLLCVACLPISTAYECQHKDIQVLVSVYHCIHLVYCYGICFALNDKSLSLISLV